MKPAKAVQPPRTRVKPVDYDFAPDDPFLQYLVQSPGVVQVEKLDMESPALEFLKNVGVKVSVPLVSQGELIGLLNLGPRLSQQDYSSDDLRLLNTLATQAAPSLRVAQLARQQEIEARTRERMENELRVARVIQQTLKAELPPGFQTAEFMLDHGFLEEGQHDMAAAEDQCARPIERCGDREEAVAPVCGERQANEQEREHRQHHPAGYRTVAQVQAATGDGLHATAERQTREPTERNGE